MSEPVQMEIPPQEQERQPGVQDEMRPQPVTVDRAYRGTGKLNEKIALITGGDSGIGQAVAWYFAREGADVVIVYREEHRDAEKTRELVSAEGRRCLLVAGDLADPAFCRQVVQQAVDEFGRLDILVNNAAVQYPQDRFEDIRDEDLEQTFRVNILAMFYLTRAALAHLAPGSVIINTTSVTAYRGSSHLVDYSSTKGAIVSFTRSLALSLAEREIRVNAVAPGPIWTPLIPASFDAEKVDEFGEDVPMGRPGQPEEVAPSYVFLAANDSSYMTGQVLHPNGGEIING
ncbi:MAG TPA: SDR family oxidoreductase [Anaerolineaceae bacterium]|nr:SDR family oxidoreductase [Anaerolineaceae bacterium]